jgi:N-methylhydantoinase B
MVPGGFSAHATEVEQEGLRLPPVKLFKRGELDREILAIIQSNIRVAEQRIGDIKAQAAALLVGESRLREMLDRHGAATLREAIGAIRARSAERMRAEVRRIPDGTYHATTYVDSDGIVDEPLRIALALTKRGEDAGFDFAGSSPPCQGPMNSVWAPPARRLSRRAARLPDVPINAGTFEPLEVIGPRAPSSMRATRAPSRAARRRSRSASRRRCSWRWRRRFRTGLGRARRHLGNFALGGFDPARGRATYVPDHRRRLWRRRAEDGLTNGCSTIGISKTAPVEVMEQYFPVLFRRFALREGSGGAGRRRGGFGVTTRWSCCAARRGPPSSWTMAASGRPVCSAARTARPTWCGCIAAVRRPCRGTCRRTRASASRPATGWR